MKSIVKELAASEASAFVGFAGNALDRRSEERSDKLLENARSNPTQQHIAFSKGKVFVDVSADPPICRLSRSDVEALQIKSDRSVLLGFEGETPVFASPVEADVEDPLPPFKAIDVRSLAMQGFLSREDLGAIAQGSSLLAWNANCLFCSRCGAPTEAQAGGYKRACTGCGREHFPRTDPVVIMLATRDDRCLLGRSHHFPPGVYSTLAGFVEPGETIEDAVRRETLEESGIVIGNVRYHASQPWPFPHSLMIGCIGEALSEQINMDQTELDDCRWFDRARVLQALEATPDQIDPAFSVPPTMAIANHLISAWAENQ
ncbi:MAG: NAD(+) diphosphatase [Pseudomonadota bacterium]